ncbi:hypothetical protein B0H99_12015 [Planomicrobium soli]|uniref:Uncharacterized protein n=1 Tax=Planomicrobium soli TaxID=1176648 RepID=A0A2P8FW90_9BACL|nr:hypothetical protein [Planomicrobium soli]PSL25990.1 hypothetical protein B0H99_12015 [Planomicrobium soli]
MIYGIAVTLGFMVVIGLFFVTLMHFLGKELHSHDAEHVDPIPAKIYRDFEEERS